MGTEGPPVLQDFLMEQEFWRRFGATSQDLENWPHRKVTDYSLIITLIRREEDAQQRKAGGRGGR